MRPITFLATLFLIGNVGCAIALAFHVPVSPGFFFLYFIGVNAALGWWVVDDCRRRAMPTSIDHGWFAFFAWPVVLPYHLVATRGLRGCLVLVAMAGLFVAAYLIAAIVYLVLT